MSHFYFTDFSINWYSHSYLLAIMEGKWLIFLPKSKIIFPPFDVMGEVIIFLYFHSLFWWKFLSTRKYLSEASNAFNKIATSTTRLYMEFYIVFVKHLAVANSFIFLPFFKGFCCHLPNFFLYAWVHMTPPSTHPHSIPHI